MYQTAIVIAAFVLVYAAVSGRIERSWLSGPVVFTLAGLGLGPEGLGVLRLDMAAEDVRLLAEATLAVVLFTDAANADFGVVRRNYGLPVRLLMVGLPLTILLGFALADWLFPDLDLLEAGILATILAPTDAALGKPVVTSQALDAPKREALNLESGLNDGICVPVVIILLEITVGTRIEGHSFGSMLTVVVEELGIGALVGVLVTRGAVALLRLTSRHGWLGEGWVQVPAVAVAILCYAGAQAAGGSGFIACFVGGLVVSWLAPPRKHELLFGAESVGETLAMLTWVAFGAISVGQVLGRFDFSILLYAVLSLTVVRMLPVYLCLVGTGMGAAGKLFIGWFGPRGLASIVFGIIVFNERLPGNFSSRTRTANTIVASPRGPNQPMKSLSDVLVRVPIRHRRTGSIRITVKLSTA
ncbi:MAG TPA: cation:proton antiporter [Stellaceae bacterium]|nr:cation:proton antiporter [Stellaceae bacterium]